MSTLKSDAEYRKNWKRRFGGMTLEQIAKAGKRIGFSHRPEARCKGFKADDTGDK